MSAKESDKFKIESQALLVNLRIAAQNLQQTPEAEDVQNSLRESLTQLSEISGLYGYNTLVSLINQSIAILNKVLHNSLSLTKEQVQFFNQLETTLTQLSEDPVMKSKKLSDSYHKLEERVKSWNNNDQPEKKDSQSSDMAGNRFQEVFTEEAYDLINQLEEKMLQLESDTEDMEMIDKVFRIMHTLKGNSNMFGYQHLGDVTHELENIYDDIRGNKIPLSREILEITLQCIDHFRNLIDDPELNNTDVKEQQYTILGEIKQVLGGKGSASPVQDLSSSQTIASGKRMHTFYLFFNPEEDIMDDGTNPMYFIYDLYELGTCVPVPVFNPILDQSSYNPEKCYTCWHILLSCDGTEEDIREHFMFLKEESQPYIRILADEDLLQKKNFTEYFSKLSSNSSKAIELDITPYITKKENNSKKKVNKESKSSKESIASVRVASQKIDEMMNLISELVTKQAELSMLVNAQENPKLYEVAEHIENISRDLRDNAFSISLIPIEKSVLRFQRLVRDVSNRFDKKVEFLVEGKETELDKTIIEKIVDPIMHILRNSIDHGIEMPAERVAKGKPESGTIRLKAYPSGAHVVIEISDDGAGINLDKVRSAAEKKGMITEHEQLREDELLNLIVSPGFSTAENISEVSGRGVGMDVVNQKIAEIRGELEINTERDKGTTITIKLPLTISIIDSLLLKCDGDFFLVPLGVVERCAEVKASTVLNAENKYVVLSEEFIPFVDLRSEFDMTGERPESQQLLLVRYRDDVVGIVVDEVIGNYQAVLKALGDVYKRQEIISGASILGSGEIALVLDTNKIIQEFTLNNTQELIT